MSDDDLEELKEEDRCFALYGNDEPEDDEFYREEFESETRQDQLIAKLEDGHCPKCKSYSILKREEPDENIFWCQHCGAKFD